MFLIQGFFCQPHSGFGMGYAPGIGSIVTIEEGFVSLMFSGIIERDESPRARGLLRGLVSDEVGIADLWSIVMSPNEIRFNKRYRDRPQSQEIEYSLHPEGNTWAGEYRAEFRSGETWVGPVRCLITEVDDEPFKRDLETLVRAHRAAHPQPKHKGDEVDPSVSTDPWPEDDGGDIPF